MKHVFAVFAACVALAFVTAPAHAASMNVASISKILSDKGYDVSDFGENTVAVTTSGLVVLVLVRGPDGDVSYLTYLSGLTVQDLGYEFINEFNHEVKFGRAYVDDDGDIAIQMDRNAAGGVSDMNIASDFDVFLQLINKFLKNVSSAAVV